jgi:hypothetical protein
MDTRRRLVVRLGQAQDIAKVQQHVEVEDVLIVETSRELVVVELGAYLHPHSPEQQFRPLKPELN